ncbi:hypothetical protein WJX79_003108 [Trebouxia sp. C0005]
MEVPDWEGGPGQDYPSLSAPAEAPISLNAQKKAKRKRKQQQTHLQALLDEPIHLMLHQPRNEGTDPHKTKKPRLSPDRHAIKPAAQIQTAACSQSEGEDAFNMMQGQPDLFEQYHEGFREQTQHWPVQPIDLAISWLKKKSPAWVAADFGCGDAQLARSVPQTVHSFDLVATAPGVTACNMADTPLEDSSVDAAVFCLALMGTDYGSFLTEACRVLRMGGLLWIAELKPCMYKRR